MSEQPGPETPIEQDRFYQIEEFVKRHKTTVLCVATAAISWKLGKKSALKSFGKELGEVLEMTYEIGRDNGVLTVHNAVLLDFVNHRGLGDDLRDFVLSLKDYDPQA